MRSISAVLCLLSSFLIQPINRADAQNFNSQTNQYTDPRGEIDLVVCSQNLHNYGLYKTVASKLGLDRDGYAEKESAIAQRIIKTKCDVVALQEVASSSEEDGRLALTQLTGTIRSMSGRVFDFVVGSSNDATMRNGFLVAKDRAEILNMLSYTKVELPKISDKQKPRFFLRSPLEIQISVKPKGEGKAKAITLINFHNKSKAGSSKDPVDLEWETYRMEMNEAIRRIIEVRHRKALLGSDNLLIVLGDRNANYDSASAKILDGSLHLTDFKTDSFCRLSKRGVPLCKPEVQTHQILYSVITNDPQTKEMPGTYKYKDTYSWIDDILLSTESLAFSWSSYDKPADYSSGVVYQPKKASDHAMVYVNLNW